MKGKYPGPDRFKGNKKKISAWRAKQDDKKDDKKKKNSFKGEYPGPEVFKGNKKLLDRWKKAGSPKAGSSKFAKEFPAKAKLIDKKKDSNKSPFEKQAEALAKSQYAGSLKTLKDSKAENKRQYDEYLDYRGDSLDKTLASNKTAGDITGNVISGLREQALGLYSKNASAQKAISSARDKTTAATNANALTVFENKMRARGIDPGKMTEMKNNFSQQSGYQSELDNIRGSYEASAEERANDLYGILQGQSSMSTNQAQGRARTSASEDVYNMSSEFQSRASGINSQIASTKLEQGNTELNTYLTLKRDYQQQQAEAQQAQLSAAIASSKQSSDDYWKQAEFGLKEADFGLDVRKADLAEQDTLNSWQNDQDKLTLEYAKQKARERMGGLKDPNYNYANRGPSNEAPPTVFS